MDFREAQKLRNVLACFDGATFKKLLQLLALFQELAPQACARSKLNFFLMHHLKDLGFDISLKGILKRLHFFFGLLV